jgi:hypothetical protein
MILRDAIAGSPLDMLKNLGDRILHLRRLHGPNAEFVVWKSDVSQAYRRLPMHILWQAKQIVTVDSERHVDQCNNFRNRGAARIWTSFMGCVAWIANDRDIDSNVYIDDTFSVDIDDDIDFYEPYGGLYPTAQVKTLCLWDEISLPHESDK